MKYYILSLTMVLLSCGVDTPIVDDVSNDNVIGVWKIDSYIDKGNNKTSNYTSYTFDFASNGTARAITASSNVSGSWQLIKDSGKSKFVLNWTTPSILEEISEDWEVKTITANTMDLIHVSGGNGGTSTLHFTKN